MDDDHARWESADRRWKNARLSLTACKPAAERQPGVADLVLYAGDP